MKRLLSVFILLILSSTSYAETIDAFAAGMGNEKLTPSGFCQQVVFIKRNTGSLISGLDKTKLILIASKYYYVDSITYQSRAVNIPVNYTVVATSQTGLYSICFSATTVPFKKTGGYVFDFLIKLNSTDNGVTKLTAELRD